LVLVLFLVKFCSHGTQQRQRSNKEIGSSSQALPRPQRTSRTSTSAHAKGNILHPLGLTHLDHIARYSCLNERVVVATRYYDEDLLAQLGILDDIHWSFARGGLSHFLQLKERTYRDMTLEFLSTLHVEVSRGPQFQAGYI